MPDRVKFGEMVERRMAQYDDILRKIEPLAKNYKHEPQDVEQMIQYMRSKIDKLETLFTSGGKVGGFKFKPVKDEPVTSVPTNEPVKLSNRKAQV